MKDFWRLFVENIWPSRRDGASNYTRRVALLQSALVLMITLAWGPEIFAAAEMTALLELLGAGLFLTAYAAALKLKILELGRCLRSILSPFGQLAVLRSGARAHTKAAAAVSMGVNAAWCSCALAVLTAFGHHVLQAVA